jgi:hypothetical protein
VAQFDPDVNASDDMISVDEAVAEFGLSRRTLFRLIESEGLRRFRKVGDRKTYLSREELSRKAAFREVPARYDDAP